MVIFLLSLIQFLFWYFKNNNCGFKTAIDPVLLLRLKQIRSKNLKYINGKKRFQGRNIQLSFYL